MNAFHVLETAGFIKPDSAESTPDQPFDKEFQELILRVPLHEQLYLHFWG